MKLKSISMCVMAGLLGVAPLLAQNPFQSVLGRYRPPRASASAASGDPIQTLIRQGVLPITVEDALRLVLAGNLDVRVDRYSPLLNQYGVQSLYRPFEPTLRLGARVSRNTRPTTTQLDGAASPTQLSHDYSIGFSQVLTTGTSVGVNLGVDRSSSNSVFNTFNPSYSGTLTYSISQPLLRNWGRDSNLHAIRVAQNNKSMSDIDFEVQLIDLASQAQLTYWDLVNSREDIKVKQRSLELAQKTLADNQRQIEIGTLAPIDALQAEAVVAAREDQRVVASYGGDQVQDRLKSMIAHVGDPAFVLAKLEPTEGMRRPVAGDLLPLEEAIQSAIESRPEMRRLELQLKSAELDVHYSRNQLLPDLTVSGSYTQSGIGGVETIRSGLGDNAILGINKGGFWDAFNQMFGYNFTGYAVAVNLTIPLSNKPAQADYSRLVSQRQLIEARRAALAESIALEVRNAQSQVEMNRTRIQATEKALELARRQLSAEEKKNQLGVSPVRFVLEEQKNLTDAEMNVNQALIQYVQSLVRYDRALGRTLQKNRIEISKESQVAMRTAVPARSGN